MMKKFQKLISGFLYNINMKDIFKKLFNKESKTEPVKKERTYLNNTQILKAV